MGEGDGSGSEEEGEEEETVAWQATAYATSSAVEAPSSTLRRYDRRRPCSEFALACVEVHLPARRDERSRSPVAISSNPVDSAGDSGRELPLTGE